MSAIPSSFDFNGLLDATSVAQVLPGCVPAKGVYGGSEGLQFRTASRKSQLAQEIVQVADRALLLASDFSPTETGQSLHQQVVSDSDWIHIQFRLNGGGHERVSKGEVIETPAPSCVVLRYPQNSIVDRTTYETDSYRVACLHLSPKSLTNLLDVPVSSLPERSLWIAREDSLALHTTILPLSSNMHLAVNDVLSCPYRGAARRAYMRAKSLELLSSVVHAMDNTACERNHADVILSKQDVSKIDDARRIMLRELGKSMTLAALARRVGLNRTKLALGFKEVYGVSVQAYWRDERLNRAREILQAGKTRVTDVALSLGYSELSSFTRAFSRKFGLLPGGLKCCRK